MGGLHPIIDPSDPRVADYLVTKDAHLRARHLAPDPQAPQVTGTGLPDGIFMAEGEAVVHHLFKSPYRVRSVFCRDDRAERLHHAAAAAQAHCPVYTASRQVMERVVGFDMHRGVLACGECRPRPGNPPLPDETALLKAAHTLVVLEEAANHDNVGSVFRAVAALAHDPPRTVGGVLLSRRSCDPLYRKSIRVSMGAALRVPWAWAEPWRDNAGGVLARLHQAGFATLALTPAPGAQPLEAVASSLRHPATPPGTNPTTNPAAGQVEAADRSPETPRPRTDASQKVAVLVGAEGPGLTQDTLSRATHRVIIPQSGWFDSLNAATATAIALHRLRR